MALKKSQLYSSLWSSCDELRGGMDASQYKDYVLTLLFMKYVSDKYSAKGDVIIDVPTGASIADMVALKGDKEIGDKINKIIGRLAEANYLKKYLSVTLHLIGLCPNSMSIVISSVISSTIPPPLCLSV